MPSTSARLPLSGLPRAFSASITLPSTQCGMDHLVDVDVHAVGDDLQLVDQADVHRAVDVLEQLGHLRRAGRAHRHDLVHRAAVERDADLEAYGRRAAADLRDRARGESRVTGILALGREAKKNVLAELEAP